MLKKFRKVWTSEIHDWLLEHKNENRKELYQKFIEKFNIHDVTYIAFNNERSRIGATNYHSNHGSTLSKPIGTESTKRGYVRIKIAQPNVWMYKAVFIWNQNHPDDIVISKKEMVIFLNGDNRDFRIENLQKIPRTIASIFNNFGGVVKGNPEETLLHIQQAKVKHEIFNRARQFGLLQNSGCFKEDTRAYYYKRKASMTEEEKESERIKRNARAKERRQKLKEENPEAYQEMLRKHNEYRRKRENDKNQNQID